RTNPVLRGMHMRHFDSLKTFPGQPCVNGVKEAGRDAGAILATSATGEIIDKASLAPFYGERMPAGR
ncbi:hypothetical protein NKG99_21700, partial [Mesorhizobium sp. M1409]|uniref:hypothetical protein n=1 Tax=Mesorhizobium sp. M1409 TaxID=2957100 RepID=UPI0033373543